MELGRIKKNSEPVTKSSVTTTQYSDPRLRIEAVGGNLLLFAFAIGMVSRNMTSIFGGDWSAILFIPHMILVAIFAIIRRPPRTKVRFFSQGFLVAICATGIPLGLDASQVSIMPFYVAGLVIQISGQCFAVYSIATLGRSFGVVPGNRTLVLAGAYRFVRHPIYAGYIIAFFGFLIAHPTFYNGRILFAYLVFQLLRIFHEEDFLKKEVEDYKAYQNQVRWRLIPRVW
jgi:protein-S-isoprenylcysteine O-methyltransferase Ste14